MKLFKLWLDHLGIQDVRQFPRDVGFPQRLLVKNSFEYIELVAKNYKLKNCYVSLYSDFQIRNSLFNKIYIDVDSESIEESYEIANKVYDKFLSKYNTVPRVYFTGCKGFAIYVDFSSIKIEPIAMKIFVQQNFDFSAIDFAVVGDVRRISRIPYTLNYNSLNKHNKLFYCYPVDLDTPIEVILSEARSPEIKQFNINFASEKLVSELIKLSYEVKKQEKQITNCEVLINEKIVNKLVERAHIIKDGRHRIIHFIIVPALVYENKSDDEIISVCRKFIENSNKNWEDYKRYVELSIKRTKQGDGKRPWKPWSIKRFLIEYPDLSDVVYDIAVSGYGNKTN